MILNSVQQGEKMNTADPTRAYVSYRSPVVLERLIAMLAEIPGVEIVGQGSDLGGALNSLWHLNPDVVIMDAHLPGGVEALKSINRRMPATVVVILTDMGFPQHRNMFHLAGADFVLDVASEFTRLEELLRDLAAKHRDESMTHSQIQALSA
jgi:two-component system, NarL family, invasion response regulator UvrY